MACSWAALTWTWSIGFRFASSVWSHVFRQAVDYWVCDCDIEIYLRRHAWGIFAGLQNVQLFATPPWHRPSHYIETPGWGLELVRSCLLYVPIPPVFTYDSGYILRDSTSQDIVWRIATSKYVICTFISFLGLACAGTSASVPGDSRVLIVKKGIMVSLHSGLHGHIDQGNVFDLLRGNCLDMNLGFLRYCRSREVDCNRCKSS